MRRLNRYVEERAPWTLAKDGEKAQELDEVLVSLAEGVRVVSLLLIPYLPASTEKLLDALGAADRSLDGARLGTCPPPLPSASRTALSQAMSPFLP